MFVEECKYAAKEKRMPEYITNDIEISSDSDREDSDDILMKKILIKKILKKKIKFRICLVFIFEAFQVISGYS